ncbi:MAG: TIGR02757 family protein [Sphingobacteriales bacterium]|nr:TIGR02757 family protein [Sphingobacteriales bacterium]MBI3718145.1 TIGR02757 family protein [Sphingobacteriales bacterium]
MTNDALKYLLDEKLSLYNQTTFIKDDPVSIPHLFTKKQDIEIAGFFAAIFSWGNRTTIINKSKELMTLMDNAPHQFILHHQTRDLKNLLHFKHRTFTADDLLYFVEFLKFHYSKIDSLETAFFNSSTHSSPFGGGRVGAGLIGFKDYFFSMEHLKRTEKHISSPVQKSTCKRLNMFLRWMVRKDKTGVDFGIWNKISPAQLICPVDVHVARVAAQLNIIQRKQVDWQTAIELTDFLRMLDAEDPVKYDYALFGMGVMNDKEGLP